MEQFRSDYEVPNRPVLLTDAAKDWPALHRWNEKDLCERYGSVQFRCEAMDISLRDYFKYSKGVVEESPLYLFDKFFSAHTQLHEDYTVPPYFEEDLFRYLGDGRPDYRWMIIGPEKSGSSFHMDPNATSAWNVTITGHKKWILYPPHVLPPGVHPSDDGSEVSHSQGKRCTHD